MNELSEYERRIGAALDRIAGALGRSAASPAGGGEDTAALQEALDAERAANAQLTERVRAIKDKQETMVAALERNVARLTQQLDAQGREVMRQKRLNAQLTDTNRSLSDAARSGVTEPHLLNRAMMTEIDALRAARAADVAEMDEILSELKPLIGEVA
jgi:septal ring factor EnvC (AmiA/AmiB activator)